MDASIVSLYVVYVSRFFLKSDWQCVLIPRAPEIRYNQDNVTEHNRYSELNFWFGVTLSLVFEKFSMFREETVTGQTQGSQEHYSSTTCSPVQGCNGRRFSFIDCSSSAWRKYDSVKKIAHVWISKLSLPKCTRLIMQGTSSVDRL